MLAFCSRIVYNDNMLYCVLKGMTFVKQFRNILILFLVIVLLGVGLYAVTKFEPKTEETATPSLPPTVSIFKTEKAKILSLTITNPDESYTLVKNGENWQVSGKPEVMLSYSRVESLLYECANITGSDLVAENVQDFSQYGLDTPERTVEIYLDGGEVKKVLIGNTAFEYSVSYLMVEGETTVYTKSTSGCKNLTCNLEELMDTAIYSMNGEDFGRVTLARDGGETIVLERTAIMADGEEPSYQWNMLKPVEKEGNSYLIEQDFMPNLLSQTAVQVIPVPGADKNYGFDKPSAVYTIESHDKSAAYTVTVGKSEGTNTYLRLKGNQAVFLVATDKLSFLEYGYIDLVNKLIHLENIKEVSGVTLRGLGSTYRMQISDENKQYMVNGIKIEEEAFRKVYQAVIGLTMDGFTDSSAPSAGDVAFTITYDKVNGGQTIVSCYHYDDRNYLVQINGKGNTLIRKKQIDNMLSTVEKALTK